MVDILHRIGVTASPDDVYAALTTVDGLAGWWTEDTTGDGRVGGVLRFRFVPGGFDMRVRELEPAKLVRWEVADGPEEWIGTTVEFELSQEDGFTIVMFRHEGWREPVSTSCLRLIRKVAHLVLQWCMNSTGSVQPSCLNSTIV